ncbi:hypothetical protein SAMN05216522_102163 [Rosenbergiella nectarea]|uniref:Uncharacterized protein n=1 Tax=Rosenbergiella nectarea TaxID=988801 RepID=A0A1H9F4C4_9GAMM|nr:hypothetical protein [Rosenbergiella nectarea]SEQ32844.1 hypothetical protein SAMN05216522_102163 [Rosenbergiella nectarea]
MRTFSLFWLLAVISCLTSCVEPIKPPPEPDWSHTIDLGAQRTLINQAVLREEN